MNKEMIIAISLLALFIIGIFIFAPSQPGPIIESANHTVEQLSVVSNGESSDVAGRISHNLVMIAPAKTAVDTTLVYKTMSPTVTNETTLDYAKKFNVTGTLKGGAVVQSKDLRYGVEISKNSGRVIYTDQKRPNAIQDSPDKLPSDDEAIKIATKFLKDQDIFPEGAVDPVVQRDNTYSSKGTITFGEIGVWYHRYLNGLNVEGTQLVVYIGGNGDVIGYFANWRDYVPDKEYPIISQEDAFDQMKTQGVSVGMNEKDVSVSIDNGYLAYHTKAGAYSEDYLEPVWVFKGNVTIDGKSVMAVQKSIPALSDESVKSLSI